MSKVRQVSGWATTDGVVHTDETLARRRQEELDFEDWCQNEFTTSYCTNGRDVAREILAKYNVSPKSKDEVPPGDASAVGKLL